MKTRDLLNRLEFSEVYGDITEKEQSYLYDFDLDIYGQEIEVALKSFRRPERRFGSLEELKKQLDLDIADGRNAKKNGCYAQKWWKTRKIL